MPLSGSVLLSQLAESWLVEVCRGSLARAGAVAHRPGIAVGGVVSLWFGHVMPLEVVTGTGQPGVVNGPHTGIVSCSLHKGTVVSCRFMANPYLSIQ